MSGENTYVQPWWSLVLGGVVAIGFGFAAIVWPGITVGVLALLLAIFIGVFGVLDLIHGARVVGREAWAGMLYLLIGALEVGLSVFLLNRVGTGLAVATLVLLIVLSFIVRGVFSIVLAFTTKMEGASKWLTVFMGVVAIVAGLIIARYPVQGTLVWVWVVGLFALISGPFQIAMGIQLKELEDKSSRVGRPKKA